ncbi:elongation factor 1-alpha, partial [Candidatus Micrarchaeota archaeon]|nr:elongation factor 1-alpha [Candidatus Micrarchaeota archaeon]
ATFQVQGAFSIGGKAVIVGQVKDGSLQIGQKTDIGGKTYTLSRIEKKHENVSQAQPGDSVGLWFDGLADKSTVKAGQILAIQ